MSLFDILILALIQGVTEFLPISSSGHLVLANALLGLEEPGIVTEIVLHLGTLLAVFVYFRGDLAGLVRGLMRFLGGERGEEARSAMRMTAAIAIGTLPAVVAGLLLGDLIESLYENPLESAIELVATGLVLLSTLWVRRGDGIVGPVRALVIGLFQALSMLPGISRSGTTIAGGLYLGVRPEEAARFSFLLSIPAILGAGILKAPELAATAGEARASALALGFGVAFFVAWASISILMRIVKRGRFGLFGVYCLIVGGLGILLFS